MANVNVNYDPNARYDMGPGAAGCGRISSQATLTADATNGLQTDTTMAHANSRCGQGVAGYSRKGNTGPNVAGAPRSYNST